MVTATKHLDYLFIYYLFSSGDKPREVRSMGWLWERLTSEDTGQHVWKPVFVALTDKEMLIFQGRAPANSRDWLKPNQNHPLICTRQTQTITYYLSIYFT